MVFVSSLTRSVSNLAANNFRQYGRLRPVQSVIFSNGGIALHLARGRFLHSVSLHGGLTELRRGFEKGFIKRKEFYKRNDICELGNIRAVRGICFCKHDESPEDVGSNKGIKSLDWPILERWDIPWDWKTTLFTMMACGLSFLFTGLAETAAISYLRIHEGHFMSLDERATLLLVDQFIITAVGLAVLYAFVSRDKPLPDDLFRFEWKEPFNLYNGWLLYGGIGLIAASLGVALAGVALNALNGEPPPRETDALMQLLPLIGASNVSTASLIGVTGILAPLYEETVFRGYLMTSLTKWFPTPAAVILSASIFAFAHLTPGEFPQLFTLGTVLGFSYAQTRNLLTPITIHAFWNSGVVLLLTLLRLQGYDIQDILQ